MALTLDGTNGIVSSGSITTQSASGVIFSDSSALTAASSPFVLKNRIINGDMRIDQRNAGASVTVLTTTGYTLDRFDAVASVSSKYSVQQNAGSVTPPAGFTNYFGVTSLSAYTVGAGDYFFVRQKIEGYNVADLAWGTANAKTITLSFWVRSSLTGTFGGALTNSGDTRSYPFSYTISSANTWEQKTITIAGDTSGTWLTTNGVGIEVRLGYGTGSTYSGTAGAWASANIVQPTGTTSVVGTNGATWYLTGVQLEIGSTATPFERRMYGQELALCQRYYQKSFSQSVAPANGFSSDSVWASGTGAWIAFSTGSPGNIRFNAVPFAVTMRAAPTMTAYSANNASVAGNWCRYNAGWADVSSFSFYSQDNCWSASAAASVTANNAYLSSGGWTASAEL